MLKNLKEYILDLFLKKDVVVIVSLCEGLKTRDIYLKYDNLEVKDIVKRKSRFFDAGSRRRVTGWRRYVKRRRRRKIEGFVLLRHQVTGMSSPR